MSSKPKKSSVKPEKTFAIWSPSLSGWYVRPTCMFSPARISQCEFAFHKEAEIQVETLRVRSGLHDLMILPSNASPKVKEHSEYPTKVLQIVAVAVAPGVDTVLSKRTYDEVVDWLKQWTAINNFRSVLASDKESGIKKCLTEFRQNLAQHWAEVKPHHFQIKIDVTDLEKGMFWRNISVSNARWVVVPEIDDRVDDTDDR